MSADFTAVLTNGLASIKAMATGASNGLRQMAGGLTKTGEEAVKAEKRFRDLGAAVARMGGPAGEIGGKLFGAAGMSGGISRLAAAAVVAGVAIKAMTSAMEVAQMRAQAFADAAAGLRDAAKGAAEAGKSFAGGAVGTGRTAAKAENIFGKDATSRADMLSRAYNVPLEDVLGAMAGSGGIRAADRGVLLESALTAAATGEMSAVEAIGMISGDKGLQRRLTAQKAGGGLSAAQRGAALLIQQNRGAAGPAGYSEALNTIGAGGPIRDRLPGLAQAESITTRGQIAAVASGAAEVAVREAAAKLINPAAVAMSAWYNQLLEAQKRLFDLADSTNPLIAALQVTGSAEQQRRRQIIGASKALGTTGN